MGEEEPVNDVSKADSNGKSMPEEKIVENIEKKDVEADGVKVLENNGVKELKRDGIKETEEKEGDGVVEGEGDKKVDCMEEVKSDVKDDGVEEVKVDKKDDDADVKEDMPVNDEEDVKEDKEVAVVEEIKEGKDVDGMKEELKNLKDDHGPMSEKKDAEIDIKESTECKEEKDKVEALKPEMDAMEVEGSTKDKKESGGKEKFGEELEGAKKEKKDEKDNTDESKAEKVEDNKVEKGSKKRARGKINGEKVNEKMKEVEKIEPRTPTNRPVRERKTVERLVASIEKDPSKEFHIEKGRGTPLKDIPNVAFKLSRRKTDDTFKLLHTILFGRRGKAVQIKNNISRFSGFVWHGNEDKQMVKVREKFDKCNKEKLMEFCDVLDITFTKTTTRKEDIVSKLINFLVAPHATTTVLLAEKEKLSKGKKRKRIVLQGSSRSGITSRRSAKSRKKNEDSSAVEERKSSTDSEDESEEEEKDREDEEGNEDGVPDKSEDEMLEKSESEDKSDSGSEPEDDIKRRKSSKASSVKKGPAANFKTEKITVKRKSRTPSKRTPRKASSACTKFHDSNVSPKVFSRKVQNEKGGKQNPSTPAKSASNEKTEKVTKEMGQKKDKLRPTDDQLRNTVCEILKEVDFNTATFTDILKKIAKQFDIDLNSRKASIKIMIQEELTKLADEVDDKDGEENAEKDENQPTRQEVET